MNVPAPFDQRTRSAFTSSIRFATLALGSSSALTGPQAHEQQHREHPFADFKAEALARWVRAAPEERLEWVMGNRLRQVILWQIVRTIGQRAVPDERLDAILEFRITGRPDGDADRYQLALAAGRCATSRRDLRQPTLTLEIDAVSFLRLTGGTVSAHRLILTRRLKLSGDLWLALSLPRVLRLPRLERAAQTPDRSARSA